MSLFFLIYLLGVTDKSGDIENTVGFTRDETFMFHL